MKIKISDIKYRFPFFLVCVGLLFTPDRMRTSVLHSEWGLINVFSWIGIVLLTKKFYRNGKITVSKKEKKGVMNPIWLLLLIFLFALESIFLSRFEIVVTIKYIYATIMPVFILYMVLNSNEIICYTEMFSDLLTVVSTIVVICGLLDLLLGTGIGEFIAKFTDVASLKESIRQGRMVSYFGHPLLTAEIMLLMFSFNTVVNFCLKKRSLLYTVYYSLIGILGVGMCGGKAGLLLIMTEFVLLYTNKKGLKYVPIIVVVAYCAFRYGLLDVVIKRFIMGFTSGDMTTGRNTSLTLVLRSGELEFNWFLGHTGTTLSERMIAALEYPPLRWAYLFGIWFSVLMCIILFLIPAIKVLKSRNMRIFTVLLVLMLEVNSYNGITTQFDHMLLYCVSVFLLLNLSYTIGESGNEDMHTSAKPIYVRRHTEGSHNNFE